MSLTGDIKLLKQVARIVSASTIANWNSGFAPSGAAGATLVTMGRAGAWCRLNLGVVILAGFNIAATVTVREYMDVAGANRLVFSDDWIMPQEMAVLSWWLDSEIFGLYRVEIYSDQGVDDGLAVPYEFRIKDW